jgi:hypothetical protein
VTEPRKLKAKPLPFAEPPHFEEADIHAVKAVWAGVANPGQQQRAMKWIINGAAKIDADPFRGDTRLTDHLVGRQSVARMILALVNTIIPETK